MKFPQKTKKVSCIYFNVGETRICKKRTKAKETQVFGKMYWKVQMNTTYIQYDSSEFLYREYTKYASSYKKLTQIIRNHRSTMLIKYQLKIFNYQRLYANLYANQMNQSNEWSQSQ